MAKKCFASLQVVKRFHQDERGMESLESVMLFAVAALVMTGVYWIWDQAQINGGTGLKGGVTKAVNSVFTLFTGVNGGSTAPAAGAGS
jgi:Flp pilus assembly pilin Flp